MLPSIPPVGGMLSAIDPQVATLTQRRQVIESVVVFVVIEVCDGQYHLGEAEVLEGAHFLLPLGDAGLQLRRVYDQDFFSPTPPNDGVIGKPAMLAAVLGSLEDQEPDKRPLGVVFFIVDWHGFA